MSSRSRAAQALAEHLSRATGTEVTVCWHNPTRRPGHGAWRVEWADGPTVAALRRLATAHARHLAPLGLGTLQWSRRYTPTAWAAALLTRAGQATLPGTAAEAVAQAGHDLDDIDGADWTPATVRAAADLAGHHANPHQMAVALIAAGVAKPRDETTASTGRPARCAHCAGALPAPAPTGRPSRWCSPACRTRAWRQRRTTGKSSNTAPGVTAPTPDRDEYCYVTPGAGTCRIHPGCVITRCHRFLCGRAVHVLDQPGRPRRFCSPACRVAEHRRLR
jgi:hypothetical protein